MLPYTKDRPSASQCTVVVDEYFANEGSVIRQVSGFFSSPPLEVFMSLLKRVSLGTGLLFWTCCSIGGIRLDVCLQHLLPIFVCGVFGRARNYLNCLVQHNGFDFLFCCVKVSSVVLCCVVFCCVLVRCVVSVVLRCVGFIPAKCHA